MLLNGLPLPEGAKIHIRGSTLPYVVYGRSRNRFGYVYTLVDDAGRFERIYGTAVQAVLAMPAEGIS